MSAQWWENDLIVGPFTDIDAANAWAAANPSSLFNGLLATAGGVQVKWGGVGVGWKQVSRKSIFACSSVGITGDSISRQHANVCEMVLTKAGINITGNWSIGGTTVAQQIAQLQAIAASGADGVMVHAGTNDYIQNLSASVTFDSAKRLIESAQALGLTVALVSCPPEGNTIFGTATRKVHEINFALYRACKIMGADYLDIWRDSADGVGASWLIPSIDGTHPVLSGRKSAADGYIARGYPINDVPIARDKAYSGLLVDSTMQSLTNWPRIDSNITITQTAYATGAKWLTLTPKPTFSGASYSYTVDQVPLISGHKYAICGIVRVDANKDETALMGEMFALPSVLLVGGTGQTAVELSEPVSLGEEPFYFEFSPSEIKPDMTGCYVCAKVYVPTPLGAAYPVMFRNISLVDLTAIGID